MKWEDGWPLCPVCEHQAELFYVSDGQIIGCPTCINKVDAVEYAAEFDENEKYVAAGV